MEISREQSFSCLQSGKWDVAVIGGGATGLGAAVDAASRGFRTVLLEQGDFAQATSSRSTKLIHGGVRYLKQGNIALVRESLHERGLLLRNAPQLVRPLEFVIPTFSIGERFFYGAGLKAYDFLAGRHRMSRSQILSTAEVRRRIPTIRPHHLSGGVSYFDAQFDDARLAIALFRTLEKLGGTALNYTRAIRLTKQGEKVSGVIAEDRETGRQFEVAASVVINATGIFTDATRCLDDPASKVMLKVSRGSHLVVDRSFLPGDQAVIIPSTDDGRVVFIIPWHGSVVIGTTDLPAPEPVMHPVPLKEEIDFLLQHASRYLDRDVTQNDIRSAFCGLRPLVSEEQKYSTAKIARDHVIRTSSSGFVTITGGKWTTYRKMGKDVVDTALAIGGLELRPSATEHLVLTGNPHDSPLEPQSAESVTQNLILQAVRHEQARTVEDILSRRCRLLLLDARKAIAIAPHVASQMAAELGFDKDWESLQIHQFTAIAQTHIFQQ